MKKIVMIGGSKGGVGKSIVTIAMAHYLIEKRERVIIIDTDTSNNDVFKIFEKEVTSYLIDLDNVDGWIELINISDRHKKDTILINTAARNNKGIKKYGETLRSTLSELKREFLTLWVINRQRDSLELLRNFLTVFPDSILHVIRNNYFGSSEKFELYNSSNTLKIIEEKKGKSLDFPDLADRVSDDLYSNRLSIKKALEQLPIGNKAELKRWVLECEKMFNQIW